MPIANGKFLLPRALLLALAWTASFAAGSPLMSSQSGASGVGTGSATTSATPDVARMEQVVQSFVTSKQFMGSVLVARGSEVLLDKGYGFADLEWNVPNTQASKFRLGSVTKQFTAASILLLEERGKLNVGDPVKKYMPDAPAAWGRITIFNLLTHTSGIPNFTSFPEYERLQLSPTTPEQLVKLFRDKPLDFQPGEQWSYSNSGYVLLGYLIEKISGDTYEKFVTENIFDPLGMKNSGYDSNSAIIPNRALGYAPSPKGPVNAGYIDMSVPLSAGGLYSTTEDLLRWEQGLYGGKLLSMASLQKMTTPFKNDYAFGLGVRTLNGHKVFDHGGGIQGFNTELAWYPDEKLAVIVLCNLNGAAPNDIAGKLASIAHGESVKLQSERKEIAVDPKVLARYVGVYQLAPGFNMLITFENGQLISQATHQPQNPLFAESETVLFPKGIDAEIEFPSVAEGSAASQMILRQNGSDRIGKRLNDPEAKEILEAAAAFQKRFKAQTAAPGSEAALRKMIASLALGEPNYADMSSDLATTTRQQLPQIEKEFAEIGALQSLTFKRVGPAWPDIYEAKFANGALEFRIWMGADGKIEGANYRPLPPPTQ